MKQITHNIKDGNEKKKLNTNFDTRYFMPYKLDCCEIPESFLTLGIYWDSECGSLCDYELQKVIEV